MQFEQPLIEGTLISRDKFRAQIKLRNGDEITAHCANPGSLMGVSEPGSRVLLSELSDPRRRFKHQLEIVFVGRTPVGIHTGRPASVVMEAIVKGKLPDLSGYATLRRDPKNISRETRVDFVLEGNGLRPCHVVAENVTMAYERIAFYPDSVAPRALTYLTELTDIVREGHRAMVVLMAARSDVEIFRPADHIDAEFGQAFRDANQRGVEITCYRTKITRKGIELDKKLPIEMTP